MPKKVLLPENRGENQAFPAIEKKEFLWVILLGLLASFLALLPTIWAYLKTPSALWFSGFNFFWDPWDINVYLANLRQGFNGHWLYQNLYDSSSTTQLPIYLPHLLLGHLARLLSLSIPFVYHLANFLLTIPFFLVIYIFLAWVFKERKWRFLALFLIAFGAGLGWLGSPFITLADMGTPDTTVFSTLHIPQFILNQLLFLVTLLSSFWALSLRKWRFSCLSTFSGVPLAFIHTYSLAGVIFILSGYLLILLLTRKRLSGVVYLLPSFFFWSVTLLLFYLLLRQNALFSQEIELPSPVNYFFSYGFLSPLALWGVVSLWRKRNEKSLFLLSWFIFQLLFIYLPFPFQRLAIKGFFIIVCTAAVWGVKEWTWLAKKRYLVYFWLPFFSVFTHLFITILLFTAFSSPKYRWTYLTREEKWVFDFLSHNSAEGEIVLASYRMGNFIPANTNNRVYFGHDVSIFNSQEKRKKITDFYSGDLSMPVPQFLQEEKIDYVFWGPEEKSLGDVDLTKEPYLENIYQNEKVTIFKVK